MSFTTVASRLLSCPEAHQLIIVCHIVPLSLSLSLSSPIISSGPLIPRAMCKLDLRVGVQTVRASDGQGSRRRSSLLLLMLLGCGVVLHAPSRHERERERERESEIDRVHVVDVRWPTYMRAYTMTVCIYNAVESYCCRVRRTIWWWRSSSSHPRSFVRWHH